MKLTRVLAITIFLLSMIVSPAKASGNTAAFIPLLSKVDPNIPIPIQTQEALGPLMPQLLAAQQSGHILEFEASMSTGILKVLHGGELDSAIIPGKQVFTDMADAAASIQLPQSRAEVSGAPTISAGGLGEFEMRLFDNCFEARKLVPNAHLIGSLRDKLGRVLAVYDSHADASGNISPGCFSWAGSYTDVAPGHKLTFKEFDGLALLKTYAVYVPNISFTAIDKLNSIARGTGPAGTPFDVSWYHPKWNATYGASLNVLVSGTISSTKTWAADFGVIKIRGNDLLHIVVRQNANFKFKRSMYAPHIYCVLGGNICQITGFAFKPAAIRIVRGAAVSNYSGQFDAEGTFWASWLNANGSPVLLRTGDKLSGTQVAQFSLPNLTAAVDFGTDIVSGKMVPNKYFELWVHTAVGNSYMIYSRSNSLGNYSSDFTGQVDLVRGQPMSIRIYYLTPATGNTLYYFRSFGP